MMLMMLLSSLKLCSPTVLFQVEPVPLCEVSFRQSAPTQAEPSRLKRKLQEFNPVAPKKRVVDPCRYAKLVHDLQLCHPNAPFLTIADTSVGVMKSADACVSTPITHLPNTASEFCPALVPAACVTVSTSEPNPKTVIEVFKDLTINSLDTDSMILTDTFVDEVMQKFTISAVVQEQIEKLTRGQHVNPQWHLYRKGVVTGSQVHHIHTRMNNVYKGKVVEADRLVQQCLGVTNFKGNAATRYGLANEARAAREYIKVNKPKHVNFQLKTSGLVLDTTHSFIGASPDRIAECECHGSWIVEIKCPASMADQSQPCFSDLAFLESNDEGRMVIKHSHQYYAQVMLYMAVCRKTRTDFVVWSPHEMLVMEVDFDANVWHDLLCSTVYFYRRFMLPELLRLQKSQV